MDAILEKYLQKIPASNPYLQKFFKIGFPSKELEIWKYSNLRSYLDPIFLPNPPLEENHHLLETGPRVVFLNGFFNPQLSQLPLGIEVVENHSKLDSEDPIELLNGGLASEIEIKIPKNFHLEDPLKILHKVFSSGDNHLICPRIKIKTGAFSKLSILESFQGEEVRYFTNAVNEIFLEQNSDLDYVQLISESAKAIHLGKMKTFCQKDSQFRSFTLSLEGAFSRSHLEVNLLQENASSAAHGIYAISGNQVCDNYIEIRHLVPFTTSEQLFKGILDDEAHGIFTGKVQVYPHAQKTSSQQLARTLLLSNKAHAHNRPILEINADDVKCTHGAAIGQLEEEAIFYLESRGIPKNKAQQILCNAFALDGINLIKSPSLKLLVSEKLLEKLLKFKAIQ